MILDLLGCSLNMGFRLGYRIVKIWRRIRRPRMRLIRRKGLRLRKLCRISGNSSFLSKCSNLCDSQEESRASLLHSPQHSEHPSHGCHFHLPHLDLHSLKLSHCHFLAHFHLPHVSHGYHSISSGHVPKGSLAVYVGQGEEHERYVIPVPYLNHPLFGELLKEVEEEYGFDQEGAIYIPCEVAHFENVRRLIDTERPQKH